MAGAFTTLNIKDGDGTSRTMRVWDESGAGTGPYDFVHVLGQKSVPHGANPTAVTEGDRAYWAANRAGIPFVIGGHPNVVTATVTVAAANGAQTDQAIATISTGNKIVVTGWSVFCANTNSGDVDVKLGFSQNSPNTLPNVDTTAKTGVLCDLHGIDANSGMVRGDGSGILGVGADAADLLYTCTSPTAGYVTITVSYYTIELMTSLLTTGAGPGAANASATIGALDGFTTGLTGAYSISRQLLTAYGGAFYSNTGGTVDTWNDQSGNSRHFTAAIGVRPAVSTAGPNSIACADFDGTDDKMATAAAFADVANNNSGWIVVSALVDTVTTNNATINLNTAIVRDSGQFMGILLKSAPTVHAYNWDGNADSDVLSISTGTAYVLSWRHEGGNVFVGTNTTESAGVASGNTTTLTGLMQLGQNGGGVATFDGKIFEMLFYDTVPSSGDRTAIINVIKSWAGA